MSLHSLNNFGDGGINLTGDKDGSLKSILKELQQLTEVVVDGAAANTNIAVAGILTEDTIVSAIAFASGVPSKVTASITSNGNIQVTSVTTGSKIVLTYFKKH
jgi:hypothetical protein